MQKLQLLRRPVETLLHHLPAALVIMPRLACRDPEPLEPAPGVAIGDENWPIEGKRQDRIRGLRPNTMHLQERRPQRFRRLAAQARYAAIAPFEYTALIWGVAIDWTFWAVLPSARMFVGATLVVASGIFLIWRERQLHVELAAATETPRNPAP